METRTRPQLPRGKTLASAAPYVCAADGGGGAQVLGHSKTILVLLGGWAFLGDRVSGRQAFGMALAVAGMVAYGVASSQCGPPPSRRRPPAAPAARARGPPMGASQHIAAAVPLALARRTSPRRRPA
jgi:drug/metabolite transporter (DMT)-like permease